MTVEELVGALREVEWSAPPRYVTEMVAKFELPRSFPKWTSHLKCNLYYYKTNYFILVTLALAAACVMRPVAAVAALLCYSRLCFAQ